MRLSLRFVLPLIIVLAAIAWGVTPLVDRFTLRWFIRDMDSRTDLIVNAMREPMLDHLRTNSKTKLANYFAHIVQDERLYAIGYCATANTQPLATRALPPQVRCASLGQWERNGNSTLESAHGPLYIAVKLLSEEDISAGWLVLIHDMSFITRRSEETQRYLFYFFMALAAVISLVTVVIAQLSWRGWVSGIRALLRGESLVRAPTPAVNVPGFQPIARDLQRLIQDLESDRRTRDESQIIWTPETLRTTLHGELRGEDIIVVSNREPYIHQQLEGAVAVHRPASGLVTALEPIMRACSGTWIAHGSGSADRTTVDFRDHIAVPPEKPVYQLRRIWLTAEEERGYYSGFANEGLWPLCHIAHVRPIFRSADWAQYVAVNEKFADAVAAEARTRNPIVLVQDYHFALLPRMIRARLPDATIISFWHIPWPNPESFAICPWREEIISGLLGSSILGFHTQFHCNNFVDTVDRFIEARVDRESFTVSLGGQPTAVRRYPISIAWPPEADMLAKPIEQCRAEVRACNGLSARMLLGIGVDRLDYTKGIAERFQAIERLLELRPEWIGRFSFIQIGAPTRADIEEYQNHAAQVRALAARINERFGRGELPPPIILKVEHIEPREIHEYYRAAELCFISSLHDGMNLVAKEFVAAHDDEQGVLILSQFTGAARELPEALIVNPYDADQSAAALHMALTMSVAEQRDRMRLMRGLVSEFNAYRWAGRMLLDAATMRRREHLLDKSIIGNVMF